MVGVGDFLLPGDPRRARRVPGKPAPPQTPEKQVSAASDYEKMRSAVAAQIDRLVTDMEEVLRPRRRLRNRSGYATGQRLDLRRAMTFEADPRTYDKLWSRPSIPERRDTAFMLLVDLSGSMRGPKTDAALAGTILLAETLQRLGVPFAVNGFQDEVIPFTRFGEGLSLPTRANIGTMPREVHGDRPGGHNKPGHNDDGPCLLEAAQDLLDWSATERLLIVVSDGLPEGKRSGPDDLRRTVKTLTSQHKELKLIGVGLGAGTGHVRDFYPESVADVPADRFAAEIGKLLRKALLRA
jgi:cobalamin biosynthesis protein CobT